MMIQTGRLALAASVLGIAFGVGGRVDAGGIALSTPAGLSPGDAFRFVFVTDGTMDATSANISDYNTFVNLQAAGATYNGSVVTWAAIGSTATVNAIDNVGQAPISGVYLADGTLVTPNTTSSGLWSGSLQHPIDRDLSQPFPFLNSLVWTGTQTDGIGTPGHQLGIIAPINPHT